MYERFCFKILMFLDVLDVLRSIGGYSVQVVQGPITTVMGTAINTVLVITLGWGRQDPSSATAGAPKRRRYLITGLCQVCELQQETTLCWNFEKRIVSRKQLEILSLGGLTYPDLQ